MTENTALSLSLLQSLAVGKKLSRSEYESLITSFMRGADVCGAPDSFDAFDNALYEYARTAALAKKRERFGDDVYVRGLVEISNYCKNDCLYCGIRKSNGECDRYRLTPDVIIERCRAGYALGFRTFVFQGGEDPWFTDERLCALICTVKSECPGAAVTLSLGERPRESYAALKAAGADRYLLRHETADPKHYASLHPPYQSFDDRMRCLRDLKELGFQTGCGFMVGSPGQTARTLATDLEFIASFQPEMVGIGPFVPQHSTPFANEPHGSLALTLFLVALVRLTLPDGLLPATTALGALSPDGRSLGLQSGANVVMPNLSPPTVRAKYTLYDNKPSTGVEDAAKLEELRAMIKKAGGRLEMGRGDAPSAKNKISN